MPIFSYPIWLVIIKSDLCLNFRVRDVVLLACSLQFEKHSFRPMEIFLQSAIAPHVRLAWFQYLNLWGWEFSRSRTKRKLKAPVTRFVKRVIKALYSQCVGFRNRVARGNKPLWVFLETHYNFFSFLILSVNHTQANFTQKYRVVFYTGIVMCLGHTVQGHSDKRHNICSIHCRRWIVLPLPSWLKVPPPLTLISYWYRF